MKKVQILLSTYNGEKYLKKQLDSLLNQDYANISILIRDDGRVIAIDATTAASNKVNVLVLEDELL